MIISGQDALHHLQHHCTADVDVPVGSSVHALMLNTSGGVEGSQLIDATHRKDSLFLTTIVLGGCFDFPDGCEQVLGGRRPRFHASRRAKAAEEQG